MHPAVRLPSFFSPVARVLLRNDVVCIGAIANVTVNIWNHTPTVAAMRAVERALQPVLQEHADGIGSIVVSRAPQPLDQETSDEAARQHRLLRSYLLALGVVQENTGMLSRLVQVSMQVIATLARQSVAPRFCRTPAEATAHVAHRLNDFGRLLVPPERLVSAVEEIVASYPPPQVP